jgi:hypothetical protein
MSAVDESGERDEGRDKGKTSIAINDIPSIFARFFIL